MDQKTCIKKTFSKEKIATTLLVTSVLAIYGGIFMGFHQAMKEVAFIGF